MIKNHRNLREEICDEKIHDDRGDDMYAHTGSSWHYNIYKNLTEIRTVCARANRPRKAAIHQGLHYKTN